MKRELLDALINVFHKDNLNDFIALLDANPNVDLDERVDLSEYKINEENNTNGIFFEVCFAGALKIAQYILNNYQTLKINIDNGKESFSPLVIACLNNDDKIVKLLLESSHIDAAKMGSAALYIAFNENKSDKNNKNNHKIIRLLLNDPRIDVNGLYQGTSLTRSLKPRQISILLQQNKNSTNKNYQ